MAAVGELTSWDSFVEAARGYGVPDPSLWVALIREIAPQEQALKDCWALVSTRRFADGYAALQAFRPRWHIENDGYRELKEGFGLEEQRWGRDAAAAHCRTTLTILAFNTAQVYRGRGGERLAKLGIRRLRRQTRPRAGPLPGGDLHGRLLRRDGGGGAAGRGRVPRPTRVVTRSRELKWASGTYLKALSPIVCSSSGS